MLTTVRVFCVYLIYVDVGSEKGWESVSEGAAEVVEQYEEVGGGMDGGAWSDGDVDRWEEGGSEEGKTGEIQSRQGTTHHPAPFWGRRPSAAGRESAGGSGT